MTRAFRPRPPAGPLPAGWPTRPAGGGGGAAPAAAAADAALDTALRHGTAAVEGVLDRLDAYGDAAARRLTYALPPPQSRDGGGAGGGSALPPRLQQLPSAEMHARRGAAVAAVRSAPALLSAGATLAAALRARGGHRAATAAADVERRWREAGVAF